MAYKDVYAAWQANPEQFWMDAAPSHQLGQGPHQALFDGNAPIYEWFSDGMVNTCYNAVDRHVENGRADQVAIIYDSPITGRQSKTTYAELKSRVEKVAGALVEKGVTKGDRVIIYMPMVTEA